jgi:hypothetical protein
MSEKARSAAANLGNTASDAATRLGDVAGATRDSVLETTNTVYETAAERARRAASGSVELASTFGQTAAKKSRDLVDVIRDQPLALGAIGLAVGATLGALFPMTETENDLIGETSDQIKGQAQAVVEQQYEKAKDFAAEQYDHAKSAAGEVLRGALDRAADKPGEPASSVGEDAPALVPPDSGAQCGGEVAKTGEKSYGQA